MKMSPLPQRRTRRISTGFTLVEMLVVIGIIVLLIGLLLPMLSRAYRNAERAKVALDLQTISTALEAYRQDMNQYPTVVNANDGARILCQALLSPDSADNYDGTPPPANTAEYGFRTRSAVGNVAQSKVYGPYIQPDRIKISDPNNLGQPAGNLATAVFIDRYRHPILYFPATRGRFDRSTGFVQSVAHTVVPQPFYNAQDNLNKFERTSGDPDAIKRIRMMLGDFSLDGILNTYTVVSQGPPPKTDTVQETPTSTGPYLLWSCGPDELYGPDEVGDTNEARERLQKCDDITNFMK